MVILSLDEPVGGWVEDKRKKEAGGGLDPHRVTMTEAQKHTSDCMLVFPALLLKHIFTVHLRNSYWWEGKVSLSHRTQQEAGVTCILGAL